MSRLEEISWGENWMLRVTRKALTTCLYFLIFVPLMTILDLSWLAQSSSVNWKRVKRLSAKPLLSRWSFAVLCQFLARFLLDFRKAFGFIFRACCFASLFTLTSKPTVQHVKASFLANHNAKAPENLWCCTTRRQSISGMIVLLTWHKRCFITRVTCVSDVFPYITILEIGPIYGCLTMGRLICVP